MSGERVDTRWANVLTMAFLLVSAMLCVVVLGVRNLYDDEVFSLDLVTAPLTRILQVSAEGDVHPPGMYLLAHLAYRIVPSFRWINLFPALLLYAGLAFFLLQVTPLFTRTRSRVCLLLLATLHPQLLMWGATIRWYGWWTGLALIALTVAVRPGSSRPTFGPARAIALGLLLAALFYLNYITFFFVFALSVAMLLRFRDQLRRRLLLPSLLSVAVFCALIAPQLRTMLTVHMQRGQAQRYGVAVSLIRLLQSVSVSEAYLPWHPLAILGGLLFTALAGVGFVALVRLERRQRGAVMFWRCEQLEIADAPRENALASIILFGLIFFLLVTASGLGGKPRNGLLLVPVLAPAVALIVGTLRPRLQDGVLIFLAIWSCVGIAHILGRYGLTKAMMDDRPEQVVAFVERNTGADCAIVVTYDSGLAYSLAQANLPRVLIVSPFRGPAFGGSRALPGGVCTRTRLYTVQSYLGGGGAWVDALNGELQSATQFIAGERRIDPFSVDPDASRKRKLSRLAALSGDLASVGRLPDYRYVVTSGEMDPGCLDTMRRQMPHFLSGYQISVDEEPVKP